MRPRHVQLSLIAALFASCAVLCTGAFAQGLDISVNWTAFVAGDPIVVSAHAAPLSQSFDAWSVILSPDGQMYFMSLAGVIAPGATPLARTVPGLPSAADATLLSMRLPQGIALGEYAAVAVLMPAGVIPTSVEDAEARCIPGCFARTTFYIISGWISADITGTWNISLLGLGDGVLTIDPPPDYLLYGTFTGGIGNATVIGFMDYAAFTLFLDFADKPGKSELILRGAAFGGQLAGTYSSDTFSPPSGTWTASHAR